MTVMLGRRVYPDAHGGLAMRPGDYGQDGAGVWWVRPPRGSSGTLEDGFTVKEHEGGTITVSPSIQGPEWHGYLKEGIWREA